jgi:hypothetical protein
MSFSNDTISISGPIAIVGADKHRHAARRLREAWSGLDWFDAADGHPPDGVPVVSLSLDASRPEGGFRLSISTESGVPRISIEGGPFSGVIYGVEELIGHESDESAGEVMLAIGSEEQAPGLPYRTFWNWDHSTNWDLEQIGVQEIGVTHPYGKPEDGFLRDFKRAVDYMSRHRIAALVIYGLFRESHGGLEAAKELCRYAIERGVRILPGVAIGAYGGIWWEGNHPFNLATWLRKHPELAAQMERPVGFQIQDLDFPLYFPNGDYTVSACPSKKANQDWMAEGIAWLAETLEIGGINIESGDYGVCGCPECAARRAAREDAARRDGYTESWSHADMADFYPRLFEAATSRRENLWLYSELQWDNMLDTAAHAPLRELPIGGIYQHTLNRTYWNRVKRDLTPRIVAGMPTRTNVFRAQFACQWNGDERTERYRFNGRDFAELCWKAHETGIQGLTVWGEPSPYIPTVEFSYLAFSRFSWDPLLGWDRFVAQEIAPRVGGAAAAERYLAIVGRIDGARPVDDAMIRPLLGDALDGAGHPDAEVARRWIWLAERLTRLRYHQATTPR